MQKEPSIKFHIKNKFILGWQTLKFGVCQPGLVEIMIKIVLIAGFALSSLVLMAQTKKVASTGNSSMLASSLLSGKKVFTQNCLSCHMSDGGGVANMNPSLIQSSYVLGDKPKIISVLLNGLSHVEIDGDNYQNVMPSHSFLSDRQIADVLTYVRNSFGNKASQISEKEVKALRPPAHSSQ